MRTASLALVCLALYCGLAAADEGAAPVALTTEQAADKVLEALEANDAGSLRTLAEQNKPDAWLVADLLCHRGERDAANTFARSASGKLHEGLPAYLKARRKSATPADARTRFARALAALEALEDPRKALATLGDPPPRLLTVTAIRAQGLRARALEATGRFEEGEAARAQAASAALRIGWLRRAIDLGNVAMGLALGRIDQPGVVRTATRTLEAATAAEDQHMQAIALRTRASALSALHRLPQAMQDAQAAARIFHALGEQSELGETLLTIGTNLLRMDRYANARDVFEKALATLTEAKAMRPAAIARARLARAQQDLGQYRLALETAEVAYADLKTLGLEQQLPSVLDVLARANRQIGDLPTAVAHMREMFDRVEKLPSQAWKVGVRGQMAFLLRNLGEYARSEAMYKQAVALAREINDKPRLGRAVQGLATIYLDQGKLSEALRANQEAVDLLKDSPIRSHAAGALRSLGDVYSEMARREEAARYYKQAAEIFREIGLISDVANTLHLWAHSESHHDRGAARALWQKARAIYARIQHNEGLRMVDLRLTADAMQSGEISHGIAALEAELKRQEAQGVKHLDPGSLGMLAYGHLQLGDFGTAERYARQSIASADARGDSTRARWAKGWLIDALSRQGRNKEAITLAYEVVDGLATATESLSEADAISRRQLMRDLFDFGLVAAARHGDMAALVHFLEMGRGNLLLTALGGRARMRSVAIPEKLRTAEARARTSVELARKDIVRFARAGKRKAVREAKARLNVAEATLQRVMERIDLEARQGANLVYLKPAPLGRIQAQLGEHDALVYYRMMNKDTMGVVVTRTAVHVKMLGLSKDLSELASRHMTPDLGSDWEPDRKALRRALVDPLELGKQTTRVLVTADGTLSYVPFTAVFGNRTVVHVPSGTVYALLRPEQHQPSEGVLAVGDPDYGAVPTAGHGARRGGFLRLTRLPATRAEAQRVGDVVLLGREATTTNLRAKLARAKRWRAVHLACHGLIDAERPYLSALALTADESSDGMLTCLDLYEAEVNADLVALSACETARGRVFGGEGIVGLTRAFMFAGAPRVLCSLWKVDDEATQALMVKFYEIWNCQAKPGDPEHAEGPERVERAKGRVEGSGRKSLGAAAALKQAQAFVRGHDEWKHPYYWAAWALWGLGD